MPNQATCPRCHALLNHSSAGQAGCPHCALAAAPNPAACGPAEAPWWVTAPPPARPAGPESVAPAANDAPWWVATQDAAPPAAAPSAIAAPAPAGTRRRLLLVGLAAAVLLAASVGAGLIILRDDDEGHAGSPVAQVQAAPQSARQEPAPAQTSNKPAEVPQDAVQPQKKQAPIQAEWPDLDGPPELPKRPAAKDQPQNGPANAEPPEAPANKAPPAPARAPEQAGKKPPAQENGPAVAAAPGPAQAQVGMFAWPFGGWAARPGSLTPQEQLLVNAAITRGVAYLLASQQASGSWAMTYDVAYAALPGLALLESGVPATAPAVQKAALLVRAKALTVSDRATYQLSLAILFLDRLGDPRDRPLIQSLAVRLLAGQNAVGGWSYDCPRLDAVARQQMLSQFRQQQPGHLQPGAPHWPMLPHPGMGFARAVPKGHHMAPHMAVPPQLMHRHAAALQAQARGLPHAHPAVPAMSKQRGIDDNSNTQFALMALWAARRHLVPTTRALALVEERFRLSQQPGGTWGYRIGPAPGRSTMTCVGLLGLAVGRGSAREALGPAMAMAPPVPQDGAMTQGLMALGALLNQPAQAGPPGRPNLYLLWSVERVGVTYNLSTIGNADWYRWGVGLLLPAQAVNGGWCGKAYFGSSFALDTSMALLFLKRANLMPDLTANLRQSLVIADPGRPAALLVPVAVPPPPAGAKNVDLWLQTDSRARPMRVPVSAEKKGPAARNALTMNFGKIKAGTQTQRQIPVRGSAPFRITGFKGTDHQLMAEVDGESKTEHVVTVSVLPEESGELNLTLRILTDLPGPREIEVHIKARAVAQP